MEGWRDGGMKGWVDRLAASIGWLVDLLSFSIDFLSFSCDFFASSIDLKI